MGQAYHVSNIVTHYFLGFIEVNKFLVTGASGSDQMGLLISPVVLRLLSVFLCLLDGLAILVPEFSLDIGYLFGPLLLVQFIGLLL